MHCSAARLSKDPLLISEAYRQDLSEGVFVTCALTASSMYVDKHQYKYKKVR